MDESLRAGVAAFNTGDYSVARTAWETGREAHEVGAPEERLLSGLSRYAAAVAAARRGAWTEAHGLASDARASLADADAFGLDADAVRESVRRLAADPETAHRRSPPALRLRGAAITPMELSFDAAAEVATLVAGTDDRFDAAAVADAVQYARAELDTPGGPRSSDGGPRHGPPRRPQRRDPGFVGLVFDFAAERDRRSLVYDRLRAHVERRRMTDRDASGLFE